MAAMDITPGKFFVKHDDKALGDITATMNVSGDRQGTIVVSFARASATDLVNGMLGDAVENLEQDMQDAVGEITNMITGQARAAIAEAGISLQASTPTVVADADLKIAYKSKAPIVVIPFTTRVGSTFAVEFCLGE
ncbi:MAG: chemotaxis protein CheX [Deltaproteobacteria bacterium]|nr:chemotaxis protein CheX [Deltaproteobacteria bacterium]